MLSQLKTESIILFAYEDGFAVLANYERLRVANRAM